MEPNNTLEEIPGVMPELATCYRTGQHPQEHGRMLCQR